VEGGKMKYLLLLALLCCGCVKEKNVEEKQEECKDSLIISPCDDIKINGERANHLKITYVDEEYSEYSERISKEERNYFIPLHKLTEVVDNYCDIEIYNNEYRIYKSTITGELKHESKMGYVYLFGRHIVQDRGYDLHKTIKTKILKITDSKKNVAKINITQLERFSKWAKDRLVECDECEEVFDKQKGVEEYENGWICNECKSKRIEKLKKKIDSLEVK
jgi:hypothetical protein